ncbi:single-stranded-DNA-specific exonuclease RecJ [Veillonellaceae bacterium M2-4]|nr:single-stranded-DNA-specific exonuclease RecJ [Veillonellaceae bacterium M2-4]
MKKQWQWRKHEPFLASEMAQSLHISTFLAEILLGRGITTVEEGVHFLHDTVADAADPHLMKGLDKAVERLQSAIEKKEKIVVYGDYDVDGITATVILYSILRDLGACVDYYIPERQSEGYGLHQEALEQLVQAQTDLLVTVDCGIASAALVSAFNSAMDIIITDHHEPPPQVPPAYAVLDAKQPDCTYPYKELAGAGVAYLLGRTLWKQMRHTTLTKYAEIAALGTIADLVPLTGENRALVKAGLQRMREGANPGLNKLFSIANIPRQRVQAGTIAYLIAPRLNASGRLSHAKRGVQLLLAEETDPQITLIAEELSALNKERQAIEKQISQQAVQQIKTGGHEQDGVLIAYGEEWHPGVIGIAASRVVEKYYRPALVISVHNGIGKGSCRSIDGFHMYQALQYAADLLIQFGGHQMAAGFSVAVENIEALRQRLCEYAAKEMKAEDYVPKIVIEGELLASDITLALVQEMEQLEPYGMKNARPIFAIKEANINDVKMVGTDKSHLQMKIRSTKPNVLTAIGWSMGEMYSNCWLDIADIAFQLDLNEFRGEITPQLVLKDIRAKKEDIHLNRAVMVDIYQLIHSYAKRFAFYGSSNSVPEIEQGRLQQYLLQERQRQYGGAVVYAVVRVLMELGILQLRLSSHGPVYVLPLIAHKLQLLDSATYRKYYAREEG